MCVLEVIFEQKCLILWFLRISFFGTQKFVSLRIFHLLWHLSVIRIILHVQCWLQTHVSDCSRIFRNKCISFRSKFTHFSLVTNTAVAICLNYSDTVNDIIPYKDSICAEWEDQLEDHASKNFSELQIEIMKPKLIDAPYQHNCELADEYSVLSNRTGCIRKSVIL